MNLRLLILMLLLPISALGKQVSFGEEEVTVLIRWQVTDTGLGPDPTYLRFPRPIYRVDNVTLFDIKPAAPKGAEPDYRELEVRPRLEEGTQKVEVLLNDGSVVRLRMKISTDEGVPNSYDFEPKRAADSGATESKSGGGSSIVDLSVLRSVLQGEIPKGMNRRTYGMNLSCRGRDIDAVLLRTFESKAFKVYQIELTNSSSQKEYRVHEEQIVLKGRDVNRSPLIHVSPQVIVPKKKGAHKAILTILTDPSMSIWRAEVCNEGTQVQLVKEQVKDRRIQ